MGPCEFPGQPNQVKETKVYRNWFQEVLTRQWTYKPTQALCSLHVILFYQQVPFIGESAPTVKLNFDPRYSLQKIKTIYMIMIKICTSNISPVQYVFKIGRYQMKIRWFPVENISNYHFASMGYKHFFC